MSKSTKSPTPAPAPSITVDGVVYVPQSSVPAATPKTGNYCIFRCRNAGVHAGEYDGTIKDGTITVRNARRLWSWRSTATLSELAIEGPVDSTDNKYAIPVPLVVLFATDVCEIIPCTADAEGKIRAVKAMNK